MDMSCSLTKQNERLTFLHITKTAGTSIEYLANEYGIKWGKYDMNLSNIACHVYIEDNAFWHVPPMYFDNSGLLQLLNNSDFFMIVRNPYERVVSELYCYWGGYRSKQYRNENITKIINADDFNSWIENNLIKIKELIESGKEIVGHWTPQHYYLYDSKKNKIVKDNNILHFENLENEFNVLMEKYNYNLSLSNSRKINRGRNKIFGTRHLSQKNKELIAQIYHKDFELFGYEK